MSVNPVPDGFRTVTPYLIVKDAATALDFYKAALGATEQFRLADPGGKVMHAEIRVGDSPVMLADEVPQIGALGPRSIGGTPVKLHLYVNDVDAFFDRAIAAGGKVTRPVQDQFYGDRSGMFEDPFGHHWSVATHKEDVSPEEMNRRFEAVMKAGAPG